MERVGVYLIYRDGGSWVFDTTGRAVLGGKGAKEMGIS
jgi:hypothetical protein